MNSETFAKIQKIITAAGAGKVISRHDAAPLLGIAFCGECGGKMYSHMNKPRFYYKCSGIKDGLCDSRTIRKELLESVTSRSPA